MSNSANDMLFGRLNRILIVFIVLINSFVLLTPFMPEISFRVNQIQAGTPAATPEFGQLDTAKNWLLIPGIDLKQHILEGQSVQTVDQGVWRRPNSSKPGQSNNTVLVGHRFTYDGASVFYHLDKVKTGDDIFLMWEGKMRAYTVSETKVVPATAVEIEDPTDREILTIYTCTPLWSSKERLVLIATPKEAS